MRRSNFKVAKKKNGLEYRVNRCFLQFGEKIMRECGRSMVEMLGVLAIIGVLSVGAISGYSKAMMKYKLNKFSEGLNSLLNYALQYTPQLEAHGANAHMGYNEILYKLNLIPDGMTYVTSTQKIFDIFNNEIVLYRNVEQDNTETNVLSISADTSDTSRQICRQALTVAKENAFALHSVSIKDDAAEGGEFSTRLWGDNYCSSGRKCLYNMGFTDTEETCDYCDDGEKICRIVIMWKQ